MSNGRATAFRGFLSMTLPPGVYEDPGFSNTPERFTNMFSAQVSGYKCTPPYLSEGQFKNEGSGMVILTGIPFYSLCEHHLAPFFGTIDIGYIPDEIMIGLSKLPRLVEVFSRRVQVQERLGFQIANVIEEELRAKGVGVTIKARHLCMEMRGIQMQGIVTITKEVRGLFLKSKVKEEWDRSCQLR